MIPRLWLGDFHFEEASPAAILIPAELEAVRWKGWYNMERLTKKNSLKALGG